MVSVHQWVMQNWYDLLNYLMYGSGSFRAKLFHPIAPTRLHTFGVWSLFTCVVQLILHISTGG